MLSTVVRRWWLVSAVVAVAAALAVSGSSSGPRETRSEAAATTELVLDPPTATAADGDPAAAQADPDLAQAGPDVTQADPETAAPGPDAVQPSPDATQQLELAARVAGQPEVAQAAAAGTASDPNRFVEGVSVSVDQSAEAVRITAHAADPDAAAQLAAAYAEAATTYVAQTTGIALSATDAPVATTADPVPQADDTVARGALGALGGLALGVLLAAALPRGRGERLRERKRLERAYGTGVLTEIPRTDSRSRYPGHVAFLTRPTGTVAEAYRRLRCVVRSGGQPGGVAPQVIAVTSAGRRDGRSSVARNLAAALAESGRRVLLVDCDFGHPTVHYGVNVEPSTGLSDLLTPADPGPTLAEVIQPTGSPGMYVLSIGTRGGREPGSLGSGLPPVLAAARRMVDVIVLDTEPLDCAGDVLDVLAMADAVLIVARAGRTPRAVAEHTAHLLGRSGADVAGVVLLGTARESDARTPYLVYRPDEEEDLTPDEVVPEPVRGEPVPV